MTLPVHIRWMVRRDFPEVMSIENRSFTPPWTEDEFLNRLRQRNVIGMVAECGPRLLGFMVYLLNKNNIELLNMAVDPECRRQGVATQMVNKLKGKLSLQRRLKIRIVVRETNLDACLFYRSQRFLATSTMRDFYTVEREGESDSFEDGYLLEYELPGEPSEHVFVNTVDIDGQLIDLDTGDSIDR